MKAIEVFYRPEMHAESGHRIAPGPAKARPLVESWRAGGLPVNINTSFDPVSRDDMKLAHDAEFVDDVMSGRALNGFGNRRPGVAAAIPWQIGSLVAAARAAMDKDVLVACSPTLGFHHAGYDSADGFCTINGLAVAAAVLHARHGAGRVGILDLDYHAGDGTQNIIRRRGWRDWVVDRSCGFQFQSPGEAGDLLLFINRSLRKMRREGVDVVLCQLGVDAHVDDPLGGMLTTAQMGRRDRLVFYHLKQWGVPVAWNLAGGYQRDAAGTLAPTMALHTQSMQQCIDIHLAGAELGSEQP